MAHNAPVTVATAEALALGLDSREEGCREGRALVSPRAVPPRGSHFAQSLQGPCRCGVLCWERACFLKRQLRPREGTGASQNTEQVGNTVRIGTWSGHLVLGTVSRLATLLSRS